MTEQDLQAIKERAELVGELGEWNAEHDEDINFILHALGDVNDLVAEVERLRAALEFYASTNNHTEQHLYREYWTPITAIGRDKGEIARHTLKGEKPPLTPEQNALIDKVIANLKALDGDK